MTHDPQPEAVPSVQASYSAQQLRLMQSLQAVDGYPPPLGPQNWYVHAAAHVELSHDEGRPLLDEGGPLLGEGRPLLDEGGPLLDERRARDHRQAQRPVD